MVKATGVHLSLEETTVSQGQVPRAAQGVWPLKHLMTPVSLP